eukprot:6490849-Amphidinium_carterae.4
MVPSSRVRALAPMQPGNHRLELSKRDARAVAGDGGRAKLAAGGGLQQGTCLLPRARGGWGKWKTVEASPRAEACFSKDRTVETLSLCGGKREGGRTAGRLTVRVWQGCRKRSNMCGGVHGKSVKFLPMAGGGKSEPGCNLCVALVRKGSQDPPSGPDVDSEACAKGFGRAGRFPLCTWVGGGGRWRYVCWQAAVRRAKIKAVEGRRQPAWGQRGRTSADWLKKLHVAEGRDAVPGHELARHHEGEESVYAPQP